MESYVYVIDVHLIYSSCHVSVWLVHRFAGVLSHKCGRLNKMTSSNIGNRVSKLLPTPPFVLDRCVCACVCVCVMEIENNVFL